MNSATTLIKAVKGLGVWGDLNVTATIDTSAANESTLTKPGNSLTKSKTTNLDTSLNSLSNLIGI